jgi:hypothetical protein
MINSSLPLSGKAEGGKEEGLKSVSRKSEASLY